MLPVNTLLFYLPLSILPIESAAKAESLSNHAGNYRIIVHGIFKYFTIAIFHDITDGYNAVFRNVHHAYICFPLTIVLFTSIVP